MDEEEGEKSRGGKHVEGRKSKLSDERDTHSPRKPLGCSSFSQSFFSLSNPRSYARVTARGDCVSSHVST